MEGSLNLVADAIERAEQDGKKLLEMTHHSQINSINPIHVATSSNSHSTFKIDANKRKILRKSSIKEDDDIVISSDDDDITISTMRKKMDLKKKSTLKKISLLKIIKKEKK
ncbi:P-loop containing nucleoside triphosphatehydrolases superfamily protein [Striga asiatica]|uniref:P-loop containing nucleoside triphosphatehydrolases superfamily protein n=1 Tax=Striga asiatica TaxID=4170 RepID=A0A5A7Q3Z2_STRAF|nr:P-loop containing nucleoside triphosphatehydrolases superfamily protein [Striga asiatica]